MKVDREQLLTDGFLILREVVPADQLEDMRRSYETLVERQGGKEWLGKGAQPRLSAGPWIDESTANAVEIWAGETTLAVAEQLMCNPDPGVAFMACMCSPLTDHGPSGWHRDIHPIDMAPMGLLEKDMLANGPRYLQWNIPLYDDSVLWVVPGSHRRLNTEEENASLRESGRVPLPGSVPVELNAGDGVVYINFLFHWGSNYSTKLRRTLHGGYSIFGDTRSSMGVTEYGHGTHQADLSFVQHLAPWARELFARFDEQSAQKKDLTEAALRAAIDKDADAYWTAVEGLQPGADDNGKLVLTIYLSKAAYHTWILHHPEDNSPPEAARHRASGSHPISLNWGPKFSERFSRSESAALWQRFTPLDRALQSDEEQFVPGYQSGAMQYYFEEALEGYRPNDFIASWDA